MAIPKKIHYIWLGGKEEPAMLKKCKKSWQKYCPDFEIIRWDESNLNIDCCNYCRLAYDAKKFAFSSDVLRFWVLKEFGGVYVDIDVEFLKPIDNLLDLEAFSGFETSGLVNPGVIIGAEKENKIICEIFEDYKSKVFEFNPKNQITVCNILTDKLKEIGLICNNTTQVVENFKVFSSDYFSPKSLTDGKIRKTKNTMTIHHFKATWLRKRDRVKTHIRQFVKRLMGEKLVNKIKAKRKVSNNETDKKPRVLHLLTSNKYSGAENVACQIISLFKEEQDLAYCSPNGQIADALKERDINFIPLNKMSKSEVKKAIKEFKPDIVHAHDPRAICTIGRIKGDFKIIAHVHSNRPDFKKKSINSILFNFITKKKKISKIIWVSESCLNDYIFCNKIKDKCLVLNNIINQQEVIDKSNIANLKDKTDIIFLGRLTYPKNPQRLIQIISEIVKKKSDIKVGIIGDGDLKEECENLTKDLKLENNVKFYGFQTNAFGLLKNSKLFLMSSRFEGNPMCVLEAETFGLPIIAPEISELKTTVVNGVSGYLYKSDEECVEIILDLLNNKEKYNKLQKSTEQFSKEYNNLERYKEILEKIYSEV